jgi:hypothetical protein
MSSASDTLEDVKELLEANWQVRWDGRTGSHYPPNQRIVEFEKDLDDESYTRVRQLNLLAKDYQEVEKLRENGDGGDGNTDEESEGSADDGGEDSESDEE